MSELLKNLTLQIELFFPFSIAATDFLTSSHQAQLKLPACGKFLVGVRSIVSTDQVLAPTNFLRIKTAYNSSILPKVTPIHKTDRNVLEFSWKHCCNLTGQHPSHYFFKIKDLTLNQTKVIAVNKTWYLYENIPMGGEYNFSISASNSSSERFIMHHLAQPLPTPRNFKRVTTTENDTYTFDWDSVAVDNEE